ncbi:MAG: Fe-S cluster assembly protein IscX, partial [Methylococcales bacterium]|nr:Fe-S cluster assembly protein IscX [Methylococcales bacterium]
MYIQELYWDATYAIVMALRQQHPHLTPAVVGLDELTQLVIKLEGFQDDLELVNERILVDIFTVWLEENLAI